MHGPGNSSADPRRADVSSHRFDPRHNFGTIRNNTAGAVAQERRYEGNAAGGPARNCHAICSHWHWLHHFQRLAAWGRLSIFVGDILLSNENGCPEKVQPFFIRGIGLLFVPGKRDGNCWRTWCIGRRHSQTNKWSDCKGNWKNW